jgi:uncharacterized membrane protein YcaP (DUF421 family)
MDPTNFARLGLSWSEAWLTALSATGIYTAVVVLSRVTGARQFAASSSYDLAFVFALGSVVGRVVLVRTTLLAGIVGLCTLFGLHAAFGWLHHHSRVVHRLMQNRPILLVADGRVLRDNLRRAHVSLVELHQELRLDGKGSLQGVRAVVLERNGSFSVLLDGEVVTDEIFDGVVGAETLRP